MKFLGFAVLICLTQIVQYSYACDGYNVKLLSITNGRSDQTIEVLGLPKIKLNEKCQLFIKGCVLIKKKIHSVKLNYRASENDVFLLREKSVDLCVLADESGYPDICKNLKPGRLCDAFNRPIELAKYRKYLSKISEGVISADAEVVTDHNDISKFHLELKFYK